MHVRARNLFLGCLLVALAACGGNPAGGGDDAGAAGPATAVESVPLSSTVESAALAAPVDVVRDEWGIPHVYGKSLPDVAFAQGYTVAQDRLVQMDLLRRNAEGTLAELVGGLSESVVDGDIAMRVHHLRATSQAAFAQLKASASPDDQLLATALGRFADGVNAYAADLKAGNYSIPPALVFLYDPNGFRPWDEVDSIMLLNFETFYFNYAADADIANTELDAAIRKNYDQSNDPLRLARKDIGKDFFQFAPIDPTYTIDGWTGMNGDTSQAALGLPDTDGNLLALLDADRRAVRGHSRDWLDPSTAASNNWVIGPKLTANGHVIVANDTHVPLQNPTIWYLIHLVGTGDRPFRAMGPSVPGVPAIVLGMNEHVAWGATTDQMDQSDVYQETIVNCDGNTNPCVLFKGNKVPLVARKESFGIGKYGKISKTIDVTFWEVPHHGPIIPRVVAKTHSLEPLGAQELSVRYVGYEPTLLLRAAEAVLFSKTVKEWAAAIDRDNKTAAFNWVVGDDQGNFGWTEIARVPHRAPGHAPWLVLPGDGSAEWGGDMDPKYIPHAWNPEKGFLATANQDPIGVTDDNEPFFTEPVVDGAPLYLTWDYVDGARQGRITKRIQAMKDAGKKITLDDMQSVQADDVTEYGELLAPTLLDGLKALSEEAGKPGTHPEVAAILNAATAEVKAEIAPAYALVKGWTFATPSGVEEDSPTMQQIADSQATLISYAWMGKMLQDTFNDEVAALGIGVGQGFLAKLLVKACAHPEKLATAIAKDTGDSIFFDDMATAPIESKRQIAAKAAVEALDAINHKLDNDITKWRWGTLHTVALDFLVPMASLRIPSPTDPKYPNGFPRHGAPETVDPGGWLYNYSYNHGPGIRFVCELDPVKGPIARNVLPGGEQFDPRSPHYRDQMELWRKNKTFDLAFQDADVLKSANAEYQARMIGRIRFAPKK